MCPIMVPVAQPAERRTVDAVVEGSNPFGHPHYAQKWALLIPCPLPFTIDDLNAPFTFVI